MAKIAAAAPDDRMAVLPTKLSGKASSRDWAFFLGSSAGTLDDDREVVRDVKAGRVVRRGTDGRRRAAPIFSVSLWNAN